MVKRFYTVIENFQNYINRNLTNEEKIIYFLDLIEVFLVWSIVLSTVHLNLVNKRQMSRATDALESFLLKIPHKSKVSQIIKNKNLICDVSTCIFVAAEITAYSKTYSIQTVINILIPFSATVVTTGNFHEIGLTVWKSRLIFKHMNSIIEVRFSRMY
jgi:hypothetical protein